MSFTSTIKNELVTIDLTKLEELSELSGLLKNTTVDGKGLNISTENASLARFLFSSLKKNYDALIKVSVKKGYNYNKNYIYGLDVYKNDNIIIKDLAIDKDIPDSYLIDDEENFNKYDMEVIGDDFVTIYNNMIRHNSLKLGIKIYSIYKRIRENY